MLVHPERQLVEERVAEVGAAGFIVPVFVELLVPVGHYFPLPAVRV